MAELNSYGWLEELHDDEYPAICELCGNWTRTHTEDSEGVHEECKAQACRECGGLLGAEELPNGAHEHCLEER